MIDLKSVFKKIVLGLDESIEKSNGLSSLLGSLICWGLGQFVGKDLKKEDK